MNDESSPLWIIVRMDGRFDGSIPREHNPTRLHPSLDEAQTECTRLLRANPSWCLAIFQGIQWMVMEKPKPVDLPIICTSFKLEPPTPAPEKEGGE